MVFFLKCCQDWNYSSYFCLSDSTLLKQLWYALGHGMHWALPWIWAPSERRWHYRFPSALTSSVHPANRMDSSFVGRVPVLTIPPAAPLRGGSEGPSVIWNEHRTGHAHCQHHSVNVPVKGTGSLLTTCEKARPVPDS